MAVASLVLGIISTIWGVILPSKIIGAIMGIVGIVLGAVVKKNDPSNGMAAAGLVLSVIGTVLCLIISVACAAACGACGVLF
ncbi:MAG: hypothetical protein ACI4FV_06675 [Lachnospiraceae bacterium]